MASPKVLIERADSRMIDDALRNAANDQLPEPTGFVRVDGKPMAVWLPDGVTPDSIGLRTFRPTRRIKT